MEKDLDMAMVVLVRGTKSSHLPRERRGRRDEAVVGSKINSSNVRLGEQFKDKLNCSKIKQNSKQNKQLNCKIECKGKTEFKCEIKSQR